MTEIEHKEIENKLKKEYVGKFIWILEDSGDFDKIVDVYVDYREEAQHMNRVVTENGNIYFITELLETRKIDKKEVFIID
jgi:hypothetical protein